MINLKPSRFVFLSVAVSLSLSACSLSEPTRFSQNSVRVEEEKIEHSVPSAELSDAALSGLAEHYRRHGDGPLNIAVTYNPQSRDNTAMRAGDKAADISTFLRGEGVEDVQAHILPIKDSAVSNVMVSYLGYNALAPKDCELMPGIENRNIVAEEDYKLGCSLDTLFARQIARPKDLLGQDTEASIDGRRSANQLEAYRSGARNSALEGQTATGN